MSFIYHDQKLVVEIKKKKIRVKVVSYYLPRFGNEKGLVQMDSKMLERLTMLEEMCRSLEDYSNFLDRIVTLNETWILRYGPETREQSKQSKHSASPLPKNFRLQKPTGKAFASDDAPIQKSLIALQKNWFWIG